MVLLLDVVEMAGKTKQPPDWEAVTHTDMGACV
jgi:hypothetical protein